MFYSRRIDLSQGQAVPVVGGARLTGRQGPYSIGFLDIHTEESEDAAAPASAFTALRLKRNILRRLQQRRRDGDAAWSGGGPDPHVPRFGRCQLHLRRRRHAAVLQVDQPDDVCRAHACRTARARSWKAQYRGRFDYTGDRYGLSAEHICIDPDFNPEMGFTRRTDVRRTFAQARFSPRPRRSRVVRKLTWQTSLDYVTDADASALQTREASALFPRGLPVERPGVD